VAGPFWREVDRGFALQHPIDVAPEFFSIVNHRYVVPDVERMQEIPVQQRLIRRGRVDERIETPLVADHPDLEQETRFRILASFGVLFGQMKPALLRSSTALRPKDGFEGEGFRAGQRMLRNKKRVIGAIELHGLAQGSLDDVRMADNGGPQAADFIEAIEGPDFGARRSPDNRTDQKE
jgi:hypothetical protein